MSHVQRAGTNGNPGEWAVAVSGGKSIGQPVEAIRSLGAPLDGRAIS